MDLPVPVGGVGQQWMQLADGSAVLQLQQDRGGGGREVEGLGELEPVQRSVVRR